MAGSSMALRALFAGAAGLLVVAVATEGCGGRDQLGVPYEESGGPGPGPGVGGSSNDGGFGGAIDVGPGPGGFGGFGGMSSSSDVGPGPTTNVTVGTSVSSVGPSTSVSSVGPSTTVSSVATSVSSVGPSTVNVSTVVGVGGMGPGTITSVGSGVGGGNPLDCLTCLANNCPSAIQCITNPVCVQGVICSVQNCLGQGPPNFVCVLNCFNNDLQAALLALQTIGCVFNQCSAECQGLIGP